MDFSELTKKYEKSLDRSFPKPVKKRKSFLEIGGNPHYENVISNFYRFYLDETEEHKFKNLFLKSLLDIISSQGFKTLQFEDYSVQTEVRTNKGGRIDILIEENDESTAVIIENKIYHELNNDLKDYWVSTKASSDNKVGVLMTLERMEPNQKGFINITHNQFIKQIESNIGHYLKNSDDLHLLFLKDLFRSIQDLNKNEMKDTLKFYFEKRKKYTS